MKKLLTLTVAAMALSAPAMAGHHMHGDDGDHDKGAMFEKYDADGDGVVTKDEFVAAHTEKAEERFAKMDADGDGSVTKGEAAEAKKEWKEKWKEKKGEWKEKMKDKMDSSE